tara:strand:- start:471 stop:1022 length:552 start_codon:yes stop_codon:yes gene_type:complete
MGMFDYITCDYDLPLPEEVKELKSPPDWKSIEYQTKSFWCSLETYSIEDDGQIYKDVVDREFIASENGILTLEETPQGIEKVTKTCELDFYTLHSEGEWDHWIEFRALVWKGEVQEIWLKEYKKESNIERLEHLKLIDEQLKNNTLDPANKNWKKFISYIMFIIRWPIAKLAQLTWKIERWLT